MRNFIVGRGVAVSDTYIIKVAVSLEQIVVVFTLQR